MKILLNNRDTHYSDTTLSIADIITKENFSYKRLVTRLNNKVVRDEEQKTTYVKNGDRLEIIHLMAGG
jgi:thiamine biosynthesis protein ThiS